MEPPHSATRTVSPMEPVSRALLAVRTLAYVALFMPSTQARELMQPPSRNVRAQVFSINRVIRTATTASTGTMCLYSVTRNVEDPDRMIPESRTISSVPSSIPRIRR